MYWEWLGWLADLGIGMDGEQFHLFLSLYLGTGLDTQTCPGSAVGCCRYEAVFAGVQTGDPGGGSMGGESRQL